MLNIEDSDIQISISSTENLLEVGKDTDEEKSLSKLSKKLNKLFSNKPTKSETNESLVIQVVLF